MNFSRVCLKLLFAAVLFSGGLKVSAEEPVRIVTLHPLLTEWVGRLTDETGVQVSCLLPGNVDLHGFSPTPAQMADAGKADLVVAMGKHLEPYLDRLKDNLPEGVDIYEAGRLVPSVKIDPNLEVFACCPVHTHGSIDPHWWHSPMAVRRGVRHLGRKLEDLLPEQKEQIRQKTRAYMDELEALHKWAEKELDSVPKERRKLVTAHAAFGYFCKEYDFVAVPVKGLTAEHNPSPAYLAEIQNRLKEEGIHSVFPERRQDGAILETLRQSAGVTVADPLAADYIPEKEEETYIALFRKNVTNIVSSLGEKKEE